MLLFALPQICDLLHPRPVYRACFLLSFILIMSRILCRDASRLLLWWFFFRAELTGITPQVLAEKKARPFRQVWRRFASWLTAVAAEGEGGVVLAAHNAKFDRGFLAAETERARLDRYNKIVL